MNNQHQNARTTFHSRVTIVQRVKEQRMHPRQVAEQFGVNVSTVYKWLRRFAEDGETALRDRSSRPHRSPRRLAVQRVATIAAMRRMRLSSPEIAASLALPVSSVTNELRRLGLNKLSRLEPRPPVVRYEHAAPGDMVHIDIKKLGRIDGVGHRITGDRSKRKRGSGWECLHVCVDDHSRLAYTELLPDEKATTATCFLIRAADWFARHGVKIRRVMTDNGSAYVSHLFRAGIAFLVLTMCGPGPTPRAPTVRPNVLSRPAPGNGPTNRPTSHRTKGRLTCFRGFMTTTTAGRTPPSTIDHHSPGSISVHNLFDNDS